MVDPTGRNANRFYQEFLALLELQPLLKRRPPRKKSRPTVYERKQDQKRLETDAASELVQRYQAGETVYELSERFNVHRHTAAAILKPNGVRLRRSPMTEREIGRAAELYSRGLSLVQVGKGVGRSAGTIRRVLVAQGIATRDSHGRPRP